MRTGYFHIIGIAMRRSGEIKSYQHNRLAGSILVSCLEQINPAAPQIQEAIFCS
jgi:hypothetical protein